MPASVSGKCNEGGWTPHAGQTRNSGPLRGRRVESSYSLEVKRLGSKHLFQRQDPGGQSLLIGEPGDGFQ